MTRQGNKALTHYPQQRREKIDLHSQEKSEYNAFLTKKEINNSMYSPEEQKYINKLISILRGNNDDKKIAVKTTLDALKRDIWDDSLRGGKKA